jgi:CII-binding regulator of phage lambda lysogenization HflD
MKTAFLAMATIIGALHHVHKITNTSQVKNTTMSTKKQQVVNLLKAIETGAAAGTIKKI